MKKKFLFTLLVALFSINCVKAKVDPFFTTPSNDTSNGIAVKVEAGKFKPIKIEKYFVTTTLYDKADNVISNLDREISKEEYLNFDKSKYDINVPNMYDYVIHETNAKRLIFEITNGTDGAYLLTSTVEWKTVPKVKSFDVIAIRTTNSPTLENYVGEQDAMVGSEFKYTIYDYKGANSKIFSNGVGISMNLYDDATADMLVQIAAEFRVNKDAIFYTSYQHATSNVTLAQSQEYNLSSDGLGGVINFTNSTIRNRYDGMAGVYIALSLV